MIPVMQKSANTCNYCRTRKQRCDRLLPGCSRCTAKLRSCDYTWFKDAPNVVEPNMTQDGPLFVQQGTYSSDISTRGRDELLHAVMAYVDREPGSASRFSRLVSDIIDLAERTVSNLLEEHAASIHQWCPIIDEGLLQKGRNGTYDDLSSELLPSPLVFLCILLLSRNSCPHSEPISTSILYTTIKQMIAIGQTSGEVSLELFRAGMLVAVYECGHGMAAQAFVTLSACVALLDLIKFDMRKPGHDMLSEETVSSLNAAIIMLDRMIPLSTMSGSLPLVCPTRQPLSTHVADLIEPAIPPPSPTPYASSPRKVHIRAIVALESGRVLEYIGAIQRGVIHVETYDEVDAAMATVIKRLVDKPQPHTWLHCDAIAMAFCSHLLLQQAETGRLGSEGVSLQDAVAAKSLLALHYSRRMAWDMVKVMIEKIEREEDLPYLPFAGLCCVIRSAIAVLETGRYENESMPDDNEIASFLKILSWFARRWNVGVKYLQRAWELLA